MSLKMSVHHSRPMLAALALSAVAAFLPTPASAQQDSTQELVSRVYQVMHIDRHDAIMTAHQICLDRRGDLNSCRYEVTGDGWFVYNTDADTQAAIAETLAAADVARRSLTLRLSLVMADHSQQETPRLAAAEARALADLRQLLPYRGYRLVESGQLQAETTGQIHMGGMPSYAADFRLSGVKTPGSTSVQFQSFELAYTHMATDAEGNDRGSRTDMILRTSFTMEVGETVVVGTSRLNGSDEALIVLLTATRNGER